MRNIIEKGKCFSIIFNYCFVSLSFFPSFTKLREVKSLEVYLFFIVSNWLKHIPETATVAIMDNSNCIHLRVRCYSPEWLQDIDHIII